MFGGFREIRQFYCYCIIFLVVFRVMKCLQVTGKKEREGAASNSDIKPSTSKKQKKTNSKPPQDHFQGAACLSLISARDSKDILAEVVEKREGRRSRDSTSVKPCYSAMPVTEEIGRRHCIPVLYTRGTHYEIGYDVGRTFASIIRDFLKISISLNESFIPAYETEEGRKAYECTLSCVKANFPQYVREIEGTADGARVPFYKLFLLHMDNITPNVCGQAENEQPVGCSSVIINNDKYQVLGHTEDALSETLNHFYFVCAHVISDKPQGKWGVTEEKFTSLCYAGHLPGYTMNYNHHGLVFSINTLSAMKLYHGKTPRHIITRALLAAENFEQANKIIRDVGTGCGDGCSINMTFLNQEDDQRTFYNIEMGPCDKNESNIHVLPVKNEEMSIHCNTYLRLGVVQIKDGLIIDSSVSRMKTLKSYPKPNNKHDVVQMLSDHTSSEFNVFQDGGPETLVKTIALGIFDCKEQTLTLYADNPNNNAPLVTLPLDIKKKTKII